MTILEAVKSDLRITHTKLDNDILSSVEACKADLANAGVTLIDDGDANILQAIRLYCRWYFDFRDKGTDFLTAYTELKKTLAMSVRYRDHDE